MHVGYVLYRALVIEIGLSVKKTIFIEISIVKVTLLVLNKQLLKLFKFDPMVQPCGEICIQNTPMHKAILEGGCWWGD